MKKIKLFYFTKKANFGDELSPYLARKLHKNVVVASKWQCNALFVGSMLGRLMSNSSLIVRLPSIIFLPSVKVWGGGYFDLKGRENVKPFRRLDVQACRGVHTLERIKKEVGVKIAKDVVLADPGILASHFIDTSQNKKKFVLGIIPHYADKENELLSKIKVTNAKEIDIQLSPEKFMNELSECENVISSSLHGLIAADSLGIPNVRMHVSGKLHGGDFKYHDYYSAYGMEEHTVIDLTKQEFTDKDLPTIKESYKIKPEQVKKLQDKLLAAFPF